MKRTSLAISTLLIFIILLSGCSLFSRKSFDKELGNNPDAADCAKVWQETETKQGVPQKWRVALKPAKGGEARGRSLEEYRKKVASVAVEVELTGKSKQKWLKAIEQKKRMPNPYLSWPDAWLENAAKQVAGVKDTKTVRTPYAYPNADVTLTLLVDKKVVAIARYDRSTQSSSVEIHY